MLPLLFLALFVIGAVTGVYAASTEGPGNFHLSFSGQPIAHSQHLWNILGMYAVGFAAVLAGGCGIAWRMEPEEYERFMDVLSESQVEIEQSCRILN